MSIACPSERRFARHAARFDCSRALLSAGSSRPIRMAIIPMTTRSSTRVKAGERDEEESVDATERRSDGGNKKSDRRELVFSLRRLIASFLRRFCPGDMHLL